MFTTHKCYVAVLYQHNLLSEIPSTVVVWISQLPRYILHHNAQHIWF